VVFILFRNQDAMKAHSVAQFFPGWFLRIGQGNFTFVIGTSKSRNQKDYQKQIPHTSLLDINRVLFMGIIYFKK
jgi:hypothetical protein